MPMTRLTSLAHGWLDPKALQTDSQEKPVADSGPLTVEDRLDIMDLLARYGACIDSHDGVAYAALFAPDGVRRIFPNSPGKADRTQKGREAIRADIQKAVDN